MLAGRIMAGTFLIISQFRPSRGPASKEGRNLVAKIERLPPNQVTQRCRLTARPLTALLGHVLKFSKSDKVCEHALPTAMENVSQIA